MFKGKISNIKKFQCENECWRWDGLRVCTNSHYSKNLKILCFITWEIMMNDVFGWEVARNHKALIGNLRWEQG